MKTIKPEQVVREIVTTIVLFDPIKSTDTQEIQIIMGPNHAHSAYNLGSGAGGTECFCYKVLTVDVTSEV